MISCYSIFSVKTSPLVFSCVVFVFVFFCGGYRESPEGMF